MMMKNIDASKIQPHLTNFIKIASELTSTSSAGMEIIDCLPVRDK